MAECYIVVRVKDKVNPDSPYLDVGLTKRGEVIAVLPPAYVPTQGEKINPDWRIFRLTRISEDEASVFISPEFPTGPKDKSRMLQRRGFKINLDAVALPAALKAFIADDTRAVPIYTLSFTYKQLEAFKLKRERRVDPGILRA